MNNQPQENAAWEKLLRERVRNLRFGTVQITVHQGRVTQIEATERIRLEKVDASGSPTRRPGDTDNQPRNEIG